MSSLAIADTEFSRQSVHTSDVAPTTEECFPAIQSVHLTSPLLFLNFPAAQDSHSPLLDLVKPALHMQTVLPDDELEDCGQSLQTALPLSVLYFPAGHAVHVFPFVPVKPTLHAHCVKRVLRIGDFEFRGQDEHALAPSSKYPVPPQD